MKKTRLFVLLLGLLAACGTPAAETPAAQAGGETPAPVLLAAGQCIEMIANGDFQGSSIDPWVFSSDNLLAFTSNANTGTQSVSLGASAELYQQITIHSGANRAELSYWWGSLQGAGGLTVTLQDTNGNVLAVLGEHPANAGQNAEAQADLSDYIGQTVRVVFETAAGADFWVDDVSLQACGPAE